jgi:hypothetical protein
MSDQQHPMSAEIEAAELRAKKAEIAARTAKAAAEEARAEAGRIVMAAGMAVKLVSNYSVHIDGSHKAWAEGEIVTRIDDVKLLLARKAPVAPVVERIEA